MPLAPRRLGRLAQPAPWLSVDTSPAWSLRLQAARPLHSPPLSSRPLSMTLFRPSADKYNVLRVYKKPAHTNEDVANVATVYVAPVSLLLHLCLASYFYTVVVSLKKMRGRGRGKRQPLSSCGKL